MPKIYTWMEKELRSIDNWISSNSKVNKLISSIGNHILTTRESRDEKITKEPICFSLKRVVLEEKISGNFKEINSRRSSVLKPYSLKKKETTP